MLRPMLEEIMENTPYETIMIDEGAWRFEENKMVRAFLFVGTEKAMVVDTCFGAGDLKTVVEGLTDLPVMLVNTHGDHDHTGGNEIFGEVYLHPSEYANYATHADCSNLRPLWEGDVIDIGGRAFEVILLPGHTPGSIALLDRENRIILTGDSVASSPIFMFGPFRNLPSLILSLEKLEALSGEYDQIYPSHGNFPLDVEAVRVQREAALRLLAGELSPQDPMRDIPAKMYIYGKAGFFK